MQTCATVKASLAATYSNVNFMLTLMPHNLDNHLLIVDPQQSTLVLHLFSIVFIYRLPTYEQPRRHKDG